MGVELGGALKNVIAIAAGVVEGTGLGHNAMAALITRGLAEISRLAIAMGGKRDTLSGLSGMGDLVLTCTGHLSRNRQVGLELGRGRPLADILTGMRMVAEGVRTTTAALELGARHGIELPITAQMASLLAGEKSPREAVEDADAPPSARRRPSRPSATMGVMGLFDRLKSSLQRTKEQLVQRFEEVVRQADAPEARTRPIDVDTLDALEEILIGADVGVGATAKIVEAVRGKSRRGAGLRDLVKQEISRIVDQRQRRHSPQSRHAAAMTDRRRQRHRQDDHRRQARELLKAERTPAAGLCRRHLPRGGGRTARDLGRPRRRRHGAGAKGPDPAAVVFDAIRRQGARDAIWCIVDTAGRLHTRVNLMSELDKIRRIAAREMPGAPHEVLLVLDATVGQNGVDAGS